MGKEKKISFEQAVERMNCGRGLDFASLFDEFIDLALCLQCNNPTQRQTDLFNKMRSDDNFRDAFITAYTTYAEEAEDYKDPLGEPFMMRVSHGQHGQFFTPDTICEFMAEILDVNGETVNDPTCGSGRLLLAALRKSRKEGRDPWIYANDLSVTCSKMTLLNLLVNSARGEVSCGDALKMDLQNFTFYKIDRVRHVSKMIWVSTYWRYTLNDVKEVSEKRVAWVNEMLMRGFMTERDVCKSSEDEKNAIRIAKRAEIEKKGQQVQLSLFE